MEWLGSYDSEIAWRLLNEGEKSDQVDLAAFEFDVVGHYQVFNIQFPDCQLQVEIMSQLDCSISLRIRACLPVMQNGVFKT